MTKNADNTDHRSGAHVRFSKQAAKSLAKNLKKRTNEHGYMNLLERLCRSAGYSGYWEAHHRPRELSMSPEVWHDRLATHLPIAFDPPLGEEELATWFERLFRPAGGALDLEDQIDGHISASVNHPRTAADSLAHSSRRTRTQPPTR